jgi:hypothetical protein
MPKVHHIEQGSAEWYQLRLGMPTSSMFHKIMQPVKMKPSSSQRGYMCQLIAERLLKESMDDQIGQIEWIERGRQFQPHAAAQFQFKENLVLEPGGFITDKLGRYGCSPDYGVKGKQEGVEIKCPLPKQQIESLLYGPGGDYKPQVQGQLMIAEFECVHWYSWHPRMPSKHVVTLRDEEYIATLKDLLLEFCDQLDAETERARKLGAYVVMEGFTTPADREYAEQAQPDPLQLIIPD